jgi:hypothetical protein
MVGTSGHKAVKISVAESTTGGKGSVDICELPKVQPSQVERTARFWLVASVFNEMSPTFRYGLRAVHIGPYGAHASVHLPFERFTGSRVCITNFSQWPVMSTKATCTIASLRYIAMTVSGEMTPHFVVTVDI